MVCKESLESYRLESKLFADKIRFVVLVAMSENQLLRHTKGVLQRLGRAAIHGALEASSDRQTIEPSNIRWWDRNVQAISQIKLLETCGKLQPCGSLDGLVLPRKMAINAGVKNCCAVLDTDKNSPFREIPEAIHLVTLSLC